MRGGIAYHFSIWPESPGPDAERRRPWPARRCSIRPAPASWALHVDGLSPVPAFSRWAGWWTEAGEVEKLEELKPWWST